jgi:sugar lactone lactonase YvrE
MAREIRTIVDGLSFAEAPRWRDGALFIADMHANRILRIGDGGAIEVVVQHDRPLSGLGWLPDGRMLIVSMEELKILRQETDGRLVDHADLSGVAVFQANDLVVAKDGTAYASNFGFQLHPLGVPQTTSLPCITPDGKVSAATDDLWFPNGMAITPDGRTLIVAESFASRLTAFDIGVGGALSNRRIWAALQDGEYPDGMCLDEEGAAWVALPMQQEFIRVREGGETVERVKGDRTALACMLGGPDRKTLFMMSSTEIEADKCKAALGACVTATEVDVAGAGLP